MSTALLSDLFVKLFSREELEVFLSAATRTASVVPGLPGREASPSVFARNAADALSRRGFIDEELFRAVLEARPGRAEEILAIRAEFERSSSKNQPAVAREISPYVVISSRTHDRDARFSFSPDATVAELVRHVRDAWNLPPHKIAPGVIAVYNYELVNADGEMLPSAARVCDVVATFDHLRLLTEIEEKATAPVYAGKPNIFSLLRDEPRQGGSTVEVTKTDELAKTEED